ncbi:MAG TPA: hypothetical protein P5137_09470, partial [Candidatus Brocadiia bacterium]|nr:hypothetical protein [Candidatus Brocadiia bacterium]
MNLSALRAWLAASLVLCGSAFGFDIIKDGKPAATILLPAQASAIEQDSAKTLVKYLKQASGAELSVIVEPAEPKGSVISVGATALAQKAGVNASGLQADGYRLAVKGGALFVIGRDTPFIV